MKRYTFSTLILSFFLSFHIATADTPSRRVEGSHQQSVAPTAGDYVRLFSDLANRDDEVRSRAFEQLTDALERRSQSAVIVKLAIEHLNNPSRLVRSYSASILGFAGSSSTNTTINMKQGALQSLISHVQKEQDEGVRSSIAWALGRFASAKPIPLLEAISILKKMSEEPLSGRFNVPRDATLALGEIGSKRYVNEITPYLLDRLYPELTKFPEASSSHGLNLIEALGRVNDRRALEGLKRAEAHKSSGIRHEAAWALGAFVFHNRYPEEIVSNAEPHPYWISTADRAAAEAVLTQLLTDTDQNAQRVARTALYHLQKEDRNYEARRREREQAERKKREEQNPPKE